jgi:hypothetical protein
VRAGQPANPLVSFLIDAVKQPVKASEYTYDYINI